MRIGDSRLRFFGGRDGDDQAMTVPSVRYVATLEGMAREWSASHDGLTFVPIGTPDWDMLAPKPQPYTGTRRPPRRQYRYG